MTHLYSATIYIDYNRYDIHGMDKSSSMIFKLQEPIKLFLEKSLCKKEYNISQALEVTIDNVGDMYTDEGYKILISFIDAKDRADARNKASSVTKHICSSMDLFLSGNNHNTHNYQPRTFFEKSKIELKEEYTRKAEDTDIVSFATNIEIGLQTTMFLTIPPDGFDKFYYAYLNDEAKMLIDTYRKALGIKDVESKYFNLFTIIEYIESKYSGYNKEQLLFTKEERKQILNNIQDWVYNKNANVRSSLSQCLSRLTDINRAEKLMNILKHLAVTDKDEGIYPYKVSNKQIQEFINQRNRLYHAGSNRKNNSLEILTIQLMDLCFKIIEAIVDRKQKES